MLSNFCSVKHYIMFMNKIKILNFIKYFEFKYFL